MSLVGHLAVEPIRAFRNFRREWDTLAPVPYRLRDGRLFIIPKSYRTDFTSIPRFLWRIEPPTGEAMEAALPHDYAYASKIMPRAEADLMFLHELEDCGVGYLKRSAMYRGVRTFGAAGYGRPEEFAKVQALIANDQAERDEMLVRLQAEFGPCVEVAA